MRIIKIAYTSDQNRKKIEKNEGDLKDIKKELKAISSDLKKVTRSIESLNIGDRRFFQQKSIFTSLQRKMERLEKVELEWKNFKKEIKDDVRREIEKTTRARINVLGPSI